jgi:hypothetical protein
MEAVDRWEQAGAVKFFITTSNVSSVLEWLVANSYISLLFYSVPQTVTEDCGKCVATFVCSMGILYVAKSMQHMLHIICDSVYVK